MFKRRISNLILPVLFIISISVSSCLAGGEEKNISFDYGFDAYYTWAEVSFGSQKDMEIDIKDENEFEIYKLLFERSLVPRFLMFEVSVNPLPCLGVIIKKHLTDFYNNTNVLRQNLTQAVCVGFEEPAALSILVGNIISFEPEGEDKEVKGKAYMGYLISMGNYHIRDNELFNDAWIEMEWKIKGERITAERNLKWSYRAGGKLHGNPEVKDVAHIALARGRIDHNYFGLDLLKNSTLEYVSDFTISPLRIIKHYIFLGRSFPSRKSKFVFSLDIGVLWESKDKYTGPLTRAGGKDIFQVVLRPNILF